MTGFWSKRKTGLSRLGDGEVQTYDGFADHCIGTEYRFAFFPKICYLTGQFIWLKNAYKKTAMWTGPGDPVFEHRWYSKHEFVLAALKGEL